MPATFFLTLRFFIYGVLVGVTLLAPAGINKGPGFLTIFLALGLEMSRLRPSLSLFPNNNSGCAGASI